MGTVYGHREGSKRWREVLVIAVAVIGGAIAATLCAAYEILSLMPRGRWTQLDFTVAFCLVVLSALMGIAVGLIVLIVDGGVSSCADENC